MSKCNQFPGAPQTAKSMEISETILMGAMDNAVQCGDSAQSEWRDKYGEIMIEVNRFAFDSEEKYRSFLNDLTALIYAYG